jgi:uncharacterized protein (TIGR01777 family)
MLMNGKAKIIVCGATGFVGRNLIPALLTAQYEISVLGRDRHKLEKVFQQSVNYLTWDELDKLIPDEFDAIINLAGANIAEGRWTEKNKFTMKQSRVEATDKVVKWCARSANKKPHIYNASAIGIYGLQPSQPALPKALNESDAATANPDNLFLIEVGQAWENATLPASQSNHPVTLMRFGVVLKRGEGMLKKLELPFQFGVGSTIGTGNQAVSWIHINDLVAAILFLLKHPEITGAVNLTAPACVSQKVFSSTLAHAMRRPLIFTLPSMVIEMLFGQMGKELLLGGQHIYPQVLEQAGFKFTYPELQLALVKEFNKSTS